MLDDVEVSAVDRAGMFRAVGDLRSGLAPAAEIVVVDVPDLGAAGTTTLATLCALAGSLPSSLASQLTIVADTTITVTVQAMLADCTSDWRVVEE